MSSGKRPPCKTRGNAIIEVVAALLALTPFIAGIPLLGKQFDVKHKTMEAARYAVWERTVWRHDGVSNRKDEPSIVLETRDRTLGHPAAGLATTNILRAEGISENPLWHDASNKPLIAYSDGLAPISIEQRQLRAPVDVGYLLVSNLAHGSGSRTIQAALGVDDLRLDRQTFARAAIAVGLRNVFIRSVDKETNAGARATGSEVHDQLVLKAEAAILSDTWSTRDESSLRRRVDDLTTNELIESLEFAGRPIAMQAPGKGKPLYGEGQFAGEPDLRPASNALPAAYVKKK